MTAYDERRYLIPFRSLLLPQIFTDTLVIGTGVAGLRAALAAAEASPEHDVILLAKGELTSSNTAWAQGGVAAVLAPDDSIGAHVDDTVLAGAGLCNVDVVEKMIAESASCIEELIDWGMRVDRDQAGRIALGREGGHGRNRILHSDGDRTGIELVRCLLARVRSTRNIRVFDRCFALDLLTAGDGGADSSGAAPVLGAITHHPRYGLQILASGSTILATGGAGQVYRESTNPDGATGDGLAMAWRAGAQLADMAFVQFHPTTLYVAGAARALITEAIRGEGAHLVTRDGHRFMPEVHELAELAPRDVVSRAIMQTLARTPDPCVYLDVRHIGGKKFAETFPGFAELLRTFSIDPGADLIPVHPSAHYTIGGVWTDQVGRTSLPNLYACGEVACTGVHGANRLASNSLLEGLVFGRRCGHAAASQPDLQTHSYQINSDIRPSDRAELDLDDVQSSLRASMWRNVGIERVGHRLRDTLDMFAFWGRYSLDKIFDDPHGWETQNMLTVGRLIACSANWREESRGAHFREDFPAPETPFACHDLWTRGNQNPTTLPTDDVVQSER